MVVGSSPTVGVAAEPTQSLSSVNLQTMHPLKNAGTADWSCLGSFSDPHQTRTNIWKRLLKFFSESGVAQWLACWAHNPKVPGSKPGYACTHSGLASPLPRSLLHIAQPVFAGTCAIFTAISGGKKPKQQGRKEQSEGNRRKKEGQRRKRNQISEKKQTEGKKERTDRGGKKQQNEGKKNKKEQKGTKQG